MPWARLVRERAADPRPSLGSDALFGGFGPAPDKLYTAPFALLLEQVEMADHETRLREAVRLAQENHRKGGRPFGAVLAFGDSIVATGVNEILRTHDISAHAEMAALREACRRLQRPNLAGGIMYASGQPCPMCLAAMVLAGIEEVYYAFGNEDAAPYGFSSAQVYEALHLQLPVSLPLNKLRLADISAAEVYGPKGSAK